MKERLNELSFENCWCARYEPRSNGIEEVFSMAKRLVKKRRLQKVSNNEEVDLLKIVKDSFKELKIEFISKCINRSLSFINLKF